MPDDFAADADDLSRLAADVRHLPIEGRGYLMRALRETGELVKGTARENATGMAHAPLFPYSITYDIVGNTHGGGALGAFVGGSSEFDIELEVGPDKDKPQGALGNLIEYGSINNPPMGIMHGALQAHEADFEREIDRATEDMMKAIGL